MARGVAHSEETKAAVMAALLSGQSISEVAKSYNLSKATVSAWRSAAFAVGSNQFEPKKNGEGLGDLIGDYLREVLVTLRVQAEAFRDKAWLARQPASEVAVLHGVLTDKAVRLLEAIDPGADGRPAGPESS
jgi:transposase-like protein